MKRNTLSVAIAIGIAFAALAAAPHFAGQSNAQSLRDGVALRAAIEKETVQGDLKGAIEQYKKIAEDAKGRDGALVAQALIRMADAYRKLGNNESQKIYERILREFPNQAEAAEARRRLAGLGGAPGSAAERRVASGLEGVNSISPDGRWIAMTDWKNAEGDLVVRDMSTGQDRRLQTASCRDAAKTCVFSDAPVFSPDSRRIAYTWYGGNSGADSRVPVISNLGRGQGQLHVISNEPGAKPIVLVSNPTFEIWPVAWWPDGKSLLVEIQRANRAWELARVSADDGTVKVLKQMGSRLLGGGRRSVSPDGRYIAYAAPAEDQGSARARARRREENRHSARDTRIYVLHADSLRDVELVKTAGVHESPMWSPDGSQILFISNLAGSWDLWSVSAREAQTASAPAIVRQDIGRIWPLGNTRSGAYYYTRSENSVEQISITEVDRDGQNVRVPPLAAPNNLIGSNPRWSPDGKSIAFLRPSKPPNKLVVHSIETGDERTYDVSLAPQSRITWFHDGKGILFPGGRLLDLLSGEVKQTVVSSVSPYALSRDDKVVYSLVRSRNDNSTMMNVSAVDLTTGQETRKPIEGMVSLDWNSLALSPDGRTLAFFNRVGSEAHLSTVAVDGTNYRDLYSTVGSINNKLLTWTHDGSAILFGQGSAEASIMRIPAKGGKAEPVGLSISQPNEHYISLNPNGTRIAFSTLIEAPDAVWVIDNIQSFLKH